MSSIPIVEHQSFEPKAVILSHTSLLTRELGNELQQQQIKPTIYYLPSAAGDSSQYPKFSGEKSLASISQVKTNDADYFFYLYPSLGAINPSEYERFFLSLPRHCKVILVEEYAHQNRLELLTASLINHDYRVALLTDPFGPFSTPQSTNPVLKALTQVSSHQPLTLTGDGQLLLFPTSTTDITSGLIKALFNSSTAGQTFYLSTLEPISQVDFVQSLRFIAADILNFQASVDYVREEGSLSRPDLDKIAATQAQLNWLPSTPLETSLRHTLSLVKELGGTVRLKPTPPTIASVLHEKTSLKSSSQTTINQDVVKQESYKLPRFEAPQVRRGSLLRLLFVFVFLLLLIPPTFLYLSITTGSSELATAYRQLEEGNTKEAKSSATSAGAKLMRARNLLNLHKKVLFFAFQHKFVQYDQFLDVGVRLSSGVANATDSVTQARKLYTVIIGLDETDFQTQNSKLASNLDALYNQLSLLEASAEKLQITSSLDEFNDLEGLKDKLPQLLTRVKLGVSLTKILPGMIGGKEPQTYLVLIQNNFELRPTGGFIAAYSLLTFKEGRLIDIKTSDTYSADALLSGTVAPPAPLKEYLGEENWYLRDSNWSPHFPETAEQVEWFIGKELNQPIDGVIGLNLFVLSSLLDGLGSINLEGQLKPINQENLFEAVEYGSQLTESGGTNSEILVPLSGAIYQKLLSGEVTLTQFIKGLDQSLSSGQLIIFSKSPEIQNFLSTNNWSGGLDNPTCPLRFAQNNCTAQTFALIEANLGVNRTNYFLKRRLDHQLTIGDNGGLHHQITVEYQNSSPSNSWPAGRYKTYTRFYAPLYTEVESVTLEDQALVFTSVPDLDLGLQEIAFPYEIPAGTDQTLIIKLRSSQILNAKSASTVAINWQKQSGTDSDPLSLKITSSLTPTQLNQPVTIDGQNLLLNTSLGSDLTFAVQFAPR